MTVTPQWKSYRSVGFLIQILIFLYWKKKTLSVPNLGICEVKIHTESFQEVFNMPVSQLKETDCSDPVCDLFFFLFCFFTHFLHNLCGGE